MAEVQEGLKYILSKIILAGPRDLHSTARHSWAQVGKWLDELSFSSGFIMLRYSDKSCLYRVYLNLTCVSIYMHTDVEHRGFTVPGMEGRFAGGLLANGECLICIKKARSYTILVPENGKNKGRRYYRWPFAIPAETFSNALSLLLSTYANLLTKNVIVIAFFHYFP